MIQFILFLGILATFIAFKRRNFLRHRSILFALAIFAFAAMLLALIPIGSASAAAPDIDLANTYKNYEYYISNYDVQVTVNSDRSYDVVETIDVYFHLESHGIIRSFPATSDSQDGFQIENINVVGDKFKIEGNDIRIGDADVEIDGEKQYVITYTLTHYADTYTDRDNMILDVIGTGWDIPIYQASASVKLPEGAVVQDYSVYSGKYGSGENEMVAYALEEGTVTLYTTDSLLPYEGITLEVNMDEGAFKDATVWQEAYILHNAQIDLYLNKYAELQVTEHYDMTVNRSTIFNRSPVYGTHTNIPRIENTRVTLPDGLSSNRIYLSVSLGDYVGERVTFSFSYTIKYDVLYQSSNRLQFGILRTDDDMIFENATVTFESEVSLDSASIGNQYGNAIRGFTQTFESEGKLVFTAEGTRMSGEPHVLNLIYTEGVFSRKNTAQDYILPAIGVGAVIALLLALLFTKREQVVAPISFYPPHGLNPAEVGFIYKQRSTGRDITSLIYYWASHGHIHISMYPKNSFVLHKVNTLDYNHNYYEYVMFNQLFRWGNTVSSAQLTETFYTTINSTMREVRNGFKGPRAIRDKKVSRWTAWGGCSLPILMALLAILLCATTFGAGWRIAGATLLLAGAGTLYAVARALFKGYKPKLSTGMVFALLFGVGTAIACSFVFFYGFSGKVLAPWSAVVFALSINLFAFMMPMLTRLTPFGAYFLGQVLGFRAFIQTAEKPRLEALLEENPSYFYDVLPYAQVLNVTKKWEEKFDGLLIAPPTYVSNYTGSVLTTHMLINSMRSVNTVMTSSPSSDGSSGSGSSGGGGGSFSGGGSGGGGGSRW